MLRLTAVRPASRFHHPVLRGAVLGFMAAAAGAEALAPILFGSATLLTLAAGAAAGARAAAAAPRRSRS